LFSSHTQPMLTSIIQMLDANTCGFCMGWKHVAIPYLLRLKKIVLAGIHSFINMQKIFKNTIHK
jgi:hypothetical protein